MATPGYPPPHSPSKDQYHEGYHEADFLDDGSVLFLLIGEQPLMEDRGVQTAMGDKRGQAEDKGFRQGLGTRGVSQRHRADADVRCGGGPCMPGHHNDRQVLQRAGLHSRTETSPEHPPSEACPEPKIAAGKLLPSVHTLCHCSGPELRTQRQSHLGGENSSDRAMWTPSHGHQSTSCLGSPALDAALHMAG